MLFLDPRTNDWFLIKNPLPTLTILILYLYFVKSWGPRFMENRKPFEFKYTLVIYNFLQVLLSIYIVYEVNPIFAITCNSSKISIYFIGNHTSLVVEIQLEMRACRLFLFRSRFAGNPPLKPSTFQYTKALTFR